MARNPTVSRITTTTSVQTCSVYILSLASTREHHNTSASSTTRAAAYLFFAKIPANFSIPYCNCDREFNTTFTGKCKNFLFPILTYFLPLRWFRVCDHLYKYAAFGEFVLPTKKRAERLVPGNKNILLYLSRRTFLNLSGGASRLIPLRAKILRG